MKQYNRRFHHSADLGVLLRYPNMFGRLMVDKNYTSNLAIGADLGV